LSVEPTRPETWQQLALTFEKSGRSEDAIRALEPLVVLEATTETISETLATRRAQPAMATEGSFDFEVMSAIAVDNAFTSKATNLVGSLSEATGKIYPHTLEAFGLTRRDRIGPRSNHPLYDLSLRIGQIFGAEFELYEHQAPAPMVAIELEEPVGIILSPRARALSHRQQTFLLSYVISLISTRLVSVLRLNAMELEVLLVGAARGANPNFATRQAQGDELNDAKELVRKAVSRKWRRAVETSAAEYAANPPGDLTRWHWAITQTAARAALLVTDELSSSIEALRHLTDLSGSEGTRLVQASREVRDLMRFWVSDRAVHVRRRANVAPTSHG
jgi:hypothetical protein